MSHEQLKEELGRLNPTMLKLHRWLTDEGDRSTTNTRFVEMHLDYGDCNYGFTFQTIGKGNHHVVDTIPGSPADGRLREMDRILTVNGTPTTALTHTMVIELLEGATSVLTMDVSDGMTHMIEQIPGSPYSPFSPSSPKTLAAPGSPRTPRSPRSALFLSPHSTPKLEQARTTPAPVSQTVLQGTARTAGASLDGFRGSGRGKVNIVQIDPSRVVLYC